MLQQRVLGAWWLGLRGTGARILPSCRLPFCALPFMDMTGCMPLAMG